MVFNAKTLCIHTLERWERGTRKYITTIAKDIGIGMQRKIQKLLNLEDGNEISANDILTQPEPKIFELRRKLTAL